MATFTIDNENTITAFGSAERAATASATPSIVSPTTIQLADLVAGYGYCS